MTVLSNIYRSLSSVIRPSSRASSSATATATASSAQQPTGMSPAQDFVQKEIAENGIVVFSKTHCPYCRATKDYFANGYPDQFVDVVELDRRPDGSAIQDYLRQLTGGRSVPRIFINGRFVGGNDALQGMPREEVDALIALQRA